MIKQLTDSYSRQLDNIRSLVSDIEPENLFLQNNLYPPATICHPVWTIGHLCISAQGMGEEMLMGNWMDKSWPDLFGQNSNPENSPDLYPKTETLLKTLDDAQSHVEKHMLSLPQKQLEDPIPDVRYHDIFPTLLHALAGIFVGHVAEHVQMLLIWRHYVLHRM